MRGCHRARAELANLLCLRRNLGGPPGAREHLLCPQSSRAPTSLRYKPKSSPRLPRPPRPRTTCPPLLSLSSRSPSLYEPHGPQHARWSVPSAWNALPPDAYIAPSSPPPEFSSNVILSMEASLCTPFKIIYSHIHQILPPPVQFSLMLSTSRQKIVSHLFTEHMVYHLPSQEDGIFIC